MPRTSVEIPTRDGRCPASVFRPAGPGPWPGVLMFMDGIGMRPALLAMGERLASHGYVVLLPDLFWRAGPYEAVEPAKLFGDPEVRKAWGAKFIASISHPLVRSDTEAYLDFLAQQPDVRQPKVGVVGYCMGGGYAIAAAGHFPERVAAAASFHGGRLATDAPESPHLLAPQMKGEIYVAGAIEDASFPDEQKVRLEQALAAAGVRHRVETYAGARHGWVPSDTPVHDPAAAERHWKELAALFDRTLRA